MERAVNGTAHEARWWHALDDGRVVCDLCPQACHLSDGQWGACFARLAVGGTLVTTGWGHPTGFQVDPVEKKPLFHFLPGSRTYSFGTVGCNLSCRFCQNWELSQARSRAAVVATPRDIASAAVQAGCRSVAFTYNDPVVFAEFALDTAAAAHERGLKTIAVTAGYLNAPARRDFYASMDAANIDLKAFHDEFYRKVCGASLRPVLDTLVYVARETSCWLEVTTLLIPGHNDGDDEIASMTQWAVRELGPDIPWHFSAFHPDHRMRDVPPTPSATLTRARTIALDAGLRFVYTGNVVDPQGAKTRCPGCGLALIDRDWFRVEKNLLAEEGRCPRCGLSIPGVFA